MPAALDPLRHPVFRMLWIATLVSNIGAWVQNTAAAWTMTALDGSPLMVGLVQAATMLPVFLLALPAGALADIVDRRRFLIGAQLWMTGVALTLCLLTATGALGPWGLLVLTFALNIGAAINFPTWAAVTPEVVPRPDLPSAIVLNGIGFNLSRAIGPALGGVLIGVAGAEAAFALNAACVSVLVAALFLWRRSPTGDRRLPPERLASAMRAGLSFVLASPAVRGATVRGTVFFLFAASIWGLLPLVVRVQLGLGPEAYGLMLGAMGAGAVAVGLVLPSLRALTDRSTFVIVSTALGGAALILLGMSRHWLPSGLAMAAFGASWIAAASTISASAQLAAPPWVRARAMGLFQVTTFGAMAVSSTMAGWITSMVGLPATLVGFGIAQIVSGWLVRRLPLEVSPLAARPDTPPLPEPEAPAPELAGVLGRSRARLTESVRYTVAAEHRGAFMAAMRDNRAVRLRAGALSWRLSEDVAHPERFIEVWSMESWTEHLREEARLTPEDEAILARAAALHRGDTPPEAFRYLGIDP